MSEFQQAVLDRLDTAIVLGTVGLALVVLCLGVIAVRSLSS